MKRFISTSIYCVLLLGLIISCNREESITPVNAGVTFSPLEKTTNNGRMGAMTSPAFVLIGFRKDNSETTQRVKLPLKAIGQDYITESVNFPSGTFQLTQFAVIDLSGKVIYATPIKGSDMAKYVADPLPLEFTIGDGTGAAVTPQVVTVLDGARPASFGYVNFEFLAAGKRIKRVVLDGAEFLLQDTLHFSNDKEKIETIDWCSHLEETPYCLNPHTESRHYNSSGQLDSITGLWKLYFSYENGLRKSIVAYNRASYYSTTTFLEYAGSYPSRIKVEFASSEQRNVDMAFNSDGDIISKTITDQNGTIIEQVQVLYSGIGNPLRKIQETPSSAVMFSYFDDFVFYFSKHVPETITASTSAAVFPKNWVIHYTSTTSDSGKVIDVRAFKGHLNIHNVQVEYE